MTKRVFYIFYSGLLLNLFIFPALSRASAHDTLAPDSANIHKGRLTATLAVQGSLYLASFGGLYVAWYKNYPQSSFHLFDDTDEWLQMDKLGHITSTYYISRLAYSTYRWSGLTRKSSVWLGGALSFAYMLNIEILDGFSSGWGFSPGDLAANTIGCALFISQQLIWDEQRFNIKYSFHPTDYPETNPELLGNNLIQKMLKDYNGMTFWLSGNISAFLPEKARFPRWLNIAIGYGAEGMTGAYANCTHNGSCADLSPERCRKFFLSMDVDLTRIPTQSKVLRGLFMLFSFIKIPSPALEFNTLGEVKFHPFYF